MQLKSVDQSKAEATYHPWLALLNSPGIQHASGGSSASRRAAIQHAKAVRNLPSASSARLAAKITASHHFTALLRFSLAMGIKQLGQAARVVQRVVLGVEQRQIAQLGTAVNVALRKHVPAHHH